MSDKSQISNRLKLESGSGPVSVVAISAPAASMAGVPSIIANSTNLSASVKPIPQHVVIPTIVSSPLQSTRQNFIPTVPTSFRIPLQNTSETSKTSGVFKSTIITSGVSPGQIITGANVTAISLANVAVNPTKQFSQVSTIVTLEQIPKVGKLPIASTKIQISTSSTNSTANITNVSSLSSGLQNSIPIKNKTSQPILVTPGPGIRPSLLNANNFAQTIPINNAPQQSIKASFLTTQHTKQNLRGMSTSGDNPITIVTRPLTQQVIKMQPAAGRPGPPIMMRPALPALMAGIRTISATPANDNIRRTNTIVQQPKTAINLMAAQATNVTSDIHSSQAKTQSMGVKAFHVPSSSSIPNEKAAKILVTQPISTTSISVSNMIVPMVTVVSNAAIAGNTSAITSSNTGLVSIAQNRIYQQNKTSSGGTMSTLVQSSISTTIPTASVAPISRSIKSDGLVRSSVTPQPTMMASITSAPPRTNISQNQIWNPHLISSATLAVSQASARHNNVVIIENPSPNQRQMQPTVAQSGEGRHAAGSNSPHPSPKPRILRRPVGPDNNSHVLKKINFDSPNIRDHRSSPKKTDLRSVSAITHLQTNQSKVRHVMGTNEISVIHPNTKAQITLQPNIDNKSKVIHGKPSITSNGFVPNMKLTAKTTKIITKTTGADGKVTQLTKYPPNREIKIKTESNFHLGNDAKILEKNSSASQLLQNQFHCLPNMLMTAPGPTHLGGYPIKTNAILANQSTRSPHLNSSHKPVPAFISRSQAQIIRPTATLPQNSNGFQYNHIHNQQYRTEFEPGKRNLFIADQSKENISQLPHPNHRVTIGQRRPMDDQSQLGMGLSPRKRPRKQTHIISQDPPDVEMIEDDFSTDDADECTDEPQIIHARQQINHDVKPSISTTPTVILPGHQSSAYITSNVRLEESLFEVKKEPPPLAFNSVKPPMEYIDKDGVRYLHERKRPPITLHSRLRFNWKSANNHFLSHNDIRVKPEKRINFNDLKIPKSNGLKIVQIAQQFYDLSNSENGILKRLEKIRDGLESHCMLICGPSEETDLTEVLSTLVTQSPGPGSATQKKCTTPLAKNPFEILSKGTKPISSPITPVTSQQQKLNKLCEEISKTKELSEANIQRCKYVSEKETDNKILLVKSLNHKEIINKLMENNTSENTLSTKRTSKKKYS